MKEQTPLGAPLEGQVGPREAKTFRQLHRPFHSRPPRVDPTRPLPAGVRIDHDMFSRDAHYYRQPTGSWHPCGGRGRCRECNKDDAMKTTEQLLRETLADHFGRGTMLTMPDDMPIFDNPLPPAEQKGMRALGDADDQIELMISIEQEFGIALPAQLGLSNPPIKDLVALVDSLLAVKNASPH